MEVVFINVYCRNAVTILLSLSLLQCKGIVSEGGFVKITITNSELNGTAIRAFQLAHKVQHLKGYLFILMHDYVEENKIEWYDPLTVALLFREPDATVLQFYWEFKRKSIWLTNANDIEVLAQDMVNFLNTITDEFSALKIVLIGHGLGALINGVSGRKYYGINGKKIGRIIALDPDEITPFLGKKLTIYKNDALFVMVIHTVSSHGIEESYGNIEFFPNGGHSQPGCSLFNQCANRRSYEYFIAAVTSPRLFLAKRCPSYRAFKRNICDVEESMGNLRTNQTGFFYLDTPDNSPFLNTYI